MSTSFTITDSPVPTAGVTSDHFDRSQGSGIFGFSAPFTLSGTTDDVRDVLGTSTTGNFGAGTTIFSAGSGRKTLSFRTAEMLNLTSFNLRVQSDGAASTIRTIQQAELFGSADNITWTSFGSTSVSIPYNQNSGVTSNAVLISGTVTNAPPAQFYRLEFENGNTDTNNGARIVELDGFGTTNTTWTGGLVREPLLFNARANGPTGTGTGSLLDQDPGFVTNITSSSTLGGKSARTAFGGSDGTEPTSLLFADGGTVGSTSGGFSSSSFTDGRTVRFLQWQVDTDLPTELAGLRLGLTAVNGDRWTDLVRLSVGSSTDNLLPVTLAGDQGYNLSSDSTIVRNGATGIPDLMFASPLSVEAGTWFKLELTHGVTSGPRLSEVEAVLIYPVPEPSTVMLLGGAGAILYALRRHGRRR